MKAYIWKIGPEFQSKQGTKWLGRRMKVVVFKELETEDEYKANVLMEGNEHRSWWPYMQVGNVFEGLQVFPESAGWGKNRINVLAGFSNVQVKAANKYKPPKVEKELPKDSNGDGPLPNQLSLI